MSSIYEINLLKRGFRKCQIFWMIELPNRKIGKPKQLKIRNCRNYGRLSRWVKKAGNGKVIMYYDEGVWLFPKHKKKSIYYGSFDENYRINNVSTVSELDIVLYQIQGWIK